MELKADDLKPLIARLSPEERVRLAQLALGREDEHTHQPLSADNEAYRRKPVAPDEFSSETEDPLAWEAEGWDEFQ